jgi:hypothetical protein
MLQHIVHVIKRLEIKCIRKHRFDYLDFFLFSRSLSTLFGFFDHSLMGSYIFCYIPLVMMDDRLTLISSASLRQK